MKLQVEKLYQISKQPSRKIIGLMSGTSLDGLDIACCELTGSGAETKLDVQHFKTVPYSEELKKHIRSIFAKRQIDFQTLCLLNPHIGKLHGQIVNQCLAEWNLQADEVDLIASHGQTVFHAPKKQHQLEAFENATLQIGDGDHLAVTTGIITISDFRQKNIAGGGEGAPLAVYGDYYLFSKKGENRILLNIGGIANFTLLPANLQVDDIFTTDTGPGNTLIDAYMRRLFRKPYDENGEEAQKGQVNEVLLSKLKLFDFFKLDFPKTTGPELFNYDYVEDAIQRTGITTLSRNDIIATLTQLTADTIVAAIENVVQKTPIDAVYVSGGGAHNPFLCSAIQAQLSGIPLKNLDEFGISGDAKEAVLFAVLANETVAGNGWEKGDNKTVAGLSMGKVSFPE